MQKRLIAYIIAIIVVLVVVFLSQQAYTRGIGKTLISDATDQIKAYTAKGSNWVMSNVYSKISTEVQKRGDVIQNEINQTKQKVTEDIPKQIENYFSGIKDAVAGKNNNSCSTQPTETPTK